AEIAGEGLRGLDRLQRKGRDSCDRREDRLRGALPGLRVPDSGLPRGGRRRRDHGLSRRPCCSLEPGVWSLQLGQLRKANSLACERSGLLFEHLRLLLQERDLLAE